MYNSIFSQNRSFTIDVQPQEWDGARSQKFKKGKRIFTSKDLLQDCTFLLKHRDPNAQPSHPNRQKTLRK